MSENPSTPGSDLKTAGLPGGEDVKLLIEQYKVFVESSNKVSERRAGAHTLLLTANTLIVSVYSVAVGKDVALRSADGAWQAALPIAGLAMTLAWFTLIRSYRALNTAKFEVIHQMEERLPMQLFEMEWSALQGKGKRHLTLSQSEQIVPVVFALLYLLLGVSVATT